MHRIYPQKSLVFRSVEQEMRSYAESVRVFRDVTLLVSLTILFIILMGLIGYVNDEIHLRSKEIAIIVKRCALAGHSVCRHRYWGSMPGRKALGEPVL